MFPSVSGTRDWSAKRGVPGELRSAGDPPHRDDHGCGRRGGSPPARAWRSVDRTASSFRLEPIEIRRSSSAMSNVRGPSPLRLAGQTSVDERFELFRPRRCIGCHGRRRVRDHRRTWRPCVGRDRTPFEPEIIS